MLLKYANPPLLEALCVLNFENPPTGGWDWTIPGLLYPRLKARFPTRAEKVENSPIPVVKFSTEDGATMVQVGRNLLAVNSLRRHIGWDELRAILLDVLREYRAVAEPGAIFSASVRYVNRIDLLTDADFALDQYFTVEPRVPVGTPPQLKRFLVHNVVEYSEPAGTLEFRFGTTDPVPGAPTNTAAFLLEYEFTVDASRAPSFSDLPSWLDGGHARISEAFYGSFTRTTHEKIFEGGRA